MHRSKKHEENYTQVHHTKNKEQAKNKEQPPKNLTRNQKKVTHYTEKYKGMDDRFLIRNNTSKKTVKKHLQSTERKKLST